MLRELLHCHECRAVRSETLLPGLGLNILTGELYPGQPGVLSAGRRLFFGTPGHLGRRRACSWMVRCSSQLTVGMPSSRGQDGLYIDENMGRREALAQPQYVLQRDPLAAQCALVARSGSEFGEKATTCERLPSLFQCSSSAHSESFLSSVQDVLSYFEGGLFFLSPQLLWDS